METALRFVIDYWEYIVILIIGLFAYNLIKKWPDVATFRFLFAGIRGGSKVRELRTELAANVVENSKKIQSVHIDSKLKTLSIREERKRLQKVIRENPKLVREVGKTLLAIEKEYKKYSLEANSEQAKEVLRLTAEQRINAVLDSFNIDFSELPEFRVDDQSE